MIFIGARDLSLKGKPFGSLVKCSFPQRLKTKTLRFTILMTSVQTRMKRKTQYIDFLWGVSNGLTNGDLMVICVSFLSTMVVGTRITPQQTHKSKIFQQPLGTYPQVFQDPHLSRISWMKRGGFSSGPCSHLGIVFDKSTQIQGGWTIQFGRVCASQIGGLFPQGSRKKNHHRKETLR